MDLPNVVCSIEWTASQQASIMQSRQKITRVWVMETKSGQVINIGVNFGTFAQCSLLGWLFVKESSLRQTQRGGPDRLSFQRQITLARQALRRHKRLIEDFFLICLISSTPFRKTSLGLLPLRNMRNSNPLMKIDGAAQTKLLIVKDFNLIVSRWWSNA